MSLLHQPVYYLLFLLSTTYSSCCLLSTTYSSCCLNLLFLVSALFLVSTHSFWCLLTLSGVYSVAGVYSFSGVYSVAGVYSFSGVCSLSGVYSLSGVLFLSGVYSLSGSLHYSLVRFTVTVGRFARMHNNSLAVSTCLFILSVCLVCRSDLSIVVACLVHSLSGLLTVFHQISCAECVYDAAAVPHSMYICQCRCCLSDYYAVIMKLRIIAMQ